MKITIKPNTTVLDVAYNLTGSLAGLPAILSQLPASSRVGFANLPLPWQDVIDIGQTYTPNLNGVAIDVKVEVLDAVAKEKAPFSTNLAMLSEAIEWGAEFIEASYDYN